MKISGVDIRPGNIIEYEGGIWRAVKIQHTQPGKGGAYMQVEMKNLIDGRKNNVRFRSAETVERVRLDTKDFQFLFKDGDALTFMDKENYEQITLPTDLLGDAAAFLQDGMDVIMELYNERPISVQLPDTIEAEIVEADAVVKGQTASSSYKPAILDNGVRVMVPPHIGAGTRIVVDVYEQTTLPRDLLGDAAAFLQDGMDVVMELYEEEPISVQLPDTIEATIVEADAVVKGQTASSSYKPAMLDNGVRVMVPPHISAGTKIVVDVYEQTYVRRAD